MSDKNVTVSLLPGVGFFTLLGLLFIGLRLGNVIDWEWIWVTFPLWFQPVIVIGGFVLFFLFAGIISILRSVFR